MKKTIKIILLVVLIIVGALIAVPFIFKNKIEALAKKEINNNVNAKVDFKNFGLTIFRSFPNLTITLDDVSVVGVEEFAGDTLAGISNTAVTVNIISVIKGDKIEIRSVQLDKARIQLLVLKDGKANWDIAKAGDSTQTQGEPSEFDIGLKKYSISDSYIIYDDASLGFYTLMDGVNHKGDGDFTQDLFTLNTSTEIKTLTVMYGGVTYVSKAKSNLDADLEMDMVNSKYTFKKNELKLNELVLGFDGFIAMPAEDINMDIKFDVRENDFKNFISMIPGVYRDGFDKVQSSGKLAFNGFAKGTYSETTMPGFGLNLNIENGKFKYPDLPTDLNNVSVDLNISNPDGVPDHTLINLKRLHLEVGKEPFDARMVIKTPVSDADIDATIKGKLDLASVSRLVPLEQGTVIAGLLNADVTAKGRMSSIDNKKYDEFNANGLINLTAFSYKSNDFKQGITISTCELVFNPKNVTLNKFDMKSGRTDIKATGWLDNLLSYAFKENELLKGTMDIKSNTIDINEFMGESTSTAAADTTPMTVFEVPEYIDFLVTVTAAKILYDDLELSNTKGNLAIRDRTLGINDVSFGMLNGNVSIDGVYDTKDVKKPFFFFNLDLAQMDIRKTYDKFVAVRKLAPIAERCNGKFTSSIDVKGNLDQKMEPVYPTLTGGGKLSTSNVIVENFPPFVKVADALKMEQFKKVNITDVNLSFKFENGRVAIAPFDVTIAGIKSTVQGSNGFDQTIDYTMAMAIPTSLMGSAATNVVSGLLTKANKAAGSNLSMGKEVKVNVKIGGTVTDPKVETGLKDAGAGVVTSVKEEIKEQFDAKKKELEDKAKAEADRLKKEAEEKVKAEADRLKKEAENKAKAEADRLKKQAEEKAKKEAEDKLKDLFGKPKK